MSRKILLCDLDAFFAAVEQRDKPFLKGKPVIVCGFNSRGVVAASSYEARRFGVHSAMPIFRAKKLCPYGYYIHPNFEKYEKISDQVYQIFYKYTDLVEHAGLDEAYLDITKNKLNVSNFAWIAKQIKLEVLEKTKLTISIGLGPNKLIAKIASDFNKPDGLTVVEDDQAISFLRDLPIRKVPGIGPITEGICWSAGIKKIEDFLKFDDETLFLWFGKNGPIFRQYASGIDERPVIVGQHRKSCGIEDTFEKDILSREEAIISLDNLSKLLEKRLIDEDICGRTIVLKVKYSNYRSVTRRITLLDPIRDAMSILKNCKSLLVQTDIGRVPIRLLGIALTQLQNGDVDPSVIQHLLFD